jgi:hypothetical protein
VRRAEPRSAGIDRPDGVTLSFQVSENNVEPSKSVLARNLLGKDDRRSTSFDETEPLGPEVLGIVESGFATRLRERLAGAASGPDGDII